MDEAGGAAAASKGTLDVVPNIACAATACSLVAVEFTIPQVVMLSQPTSTPLPAATLGHRLAMSGRLFGPQFGITAVQFGLIRELRDALDRAFGPSPLHLSVAYGSSAPFMAAKYNLIISGAYGYSGFRAPGAGAGAASPLEAAGRFWRKNVAPGLVWSFLRDCGSVGGGIVLAPVVTPRLAGALGADAEKHATVKFAGGLAAGATCGLATQLFHNAALTAGRMRESTGALPGTAEAMGRVLAEHGARALYVNFQFRVAVIALWTAILNVTVPFEK